MTNPSHGAVSLAADGSLTYTPDADWCGADTFIYKAFDGIKVSNPATVSIVVNPVNDAPVGVEDQYDVSWNGYFCASMEEGLLANDIYGFCTRAGYADYAGWNYLYDASISKTRFAMDLNSRILRWPSCTDSQEWRKDVRSR